MQKIFIIQLCIAFKLFTIKVRKHHFSLNVVISGWVKAIIDLHLMKHALRFGIVCVSYSSLAPLIDKPKGQYSNILKHWRLESMEIIAMGCLGLDKSTTICVAVKPVLLD